MDFIFNFGAMFESPHAYQAHEKRPAAALYTGAMRRWVAVTLGIAIVLDIAILACAIVIVVNLPKTLSDEISSGGWAPYYSLGSATIRLGLYWCTVPTILLITSLIEVIKLRRGSLTPTYPIVAASLSIILWLACLGMWADCIYYPSHESFSVVCPNNFSPFEDSTEFWGSIVVLRRVTPFLVVPAIVAYLCHLACGVLAFRREKQTDRYSQRTLLMKAQELNEVEHHEPAKDACQPVQRLPSYHERGSLEVPTGPSRPPSYQAH